MPFYHELLPDRARWKVFVDALYFANSVATLTRKSTTAKKPKVEAVAVLVGLGPCTVCCVLYLFPLFFELLIYVHTKS